MEKRAKTIYSVIARYVLLILVALPNLWLFYLLFTPLTIYPVFFLLKIFYDVSLFQSNIILGNNVIQIGEACIAGSAYYLLLILNMATPMHVKKRIFSLLFIFSAFLIINILRIFFFSLLFVYSFSLFSLTHLIFWYLLSAFIVFFIWIINAKIFRINAIPVYSDIEGIMGIIKTS